MINIELIKQNIHEYKIEKICDMIVCDRYFGYNTDLTKICMEELALRRINGDSFEFEEYIEKSLKELPKLDFSIPDIKSLINNFKK